MNKEIQTKDKNNTNTGNNKPIRRPERGGNPNFIRNPHAPASVGKKRS